jgi:hypothetical protein
VKFFFLDFCAYQRPHKFVVPAGGRHRQRMWSSTEPDGRSFCNYRCRGNDGHSVQLFASRYKHLGSNIEAWYFTSRGQVSLHYLSPVLAFSHFQKIQLTFSETYQLLAVADMIPGFV